MRYLLVLISYFSLASSLAFGEMYKYSELEIKGYDEMEKIVRARVDKASEIDLENQRIADEEGRVDYDDYQSIDLLKDALRIILSRPNRDNLVSKLLPPVRSELLKYGSFYDSVNDLAVESATGINQKTNVVYRSTYIFVLENIMSELRPELSQNKKEVIEIYEYIMNANIEIPEDVRLDRKLRSMVKSQSPSDTAKLILESDVEKYRKKKKKGFWNWLFG